MGSSSSCGTQKQRRSGAPVADFQQPPATTPLRPDEKIALPAFTDQLQSVEQGIYLMQATGDFTFAGGQPRLQEPFVEMRLDPFIYSRHDDYVPHDPFDQWRPGYKGEAGPVPGPVTGPAPESIARHAHEFDKFSASLFQDTTRDHSEGLFQGDRLPADQRANMHNDFPEIQRVSDARDTDMHLMAGPPLRRSHPAEARVAMLPKHGADEAYALPVLPKATNAALVGEIIHPPVPEYAWAGNRAGPASMVYPPASMGYPPASMVQPFHEGPAQRSTQSAAPPYHSARSAAYGNPAAHQWPASAVLPGPRPGAHSSTNRTLGTSAAPSYRGSPSRLPSSMLCVV